MKFTLKSFVSLLLCMVLVAASALFAIGCTDKSNVPPNSTESAEKEVPEEIREIGEGEKSFTLKVVDKKGNTALFSVSTDKKTVGEALIEHELLEGEEGPYGLYIKKVMGIEADFDKDQTYWAFYINGEYAMSGVDTTDIENGAEYTLKVES